ncbi:hypothetical protein pb186bvf_018152 [Paramecium bursaria]
MSSSKDQNPPLQQNSQNQPTNVSTLQIYQVRENFRNNNRNNHVQGQINSKRKQQQLALQQQVRMDFYGLLNIFKQQPDKTNFWALVQYIRDEVDTAIRLSYQNSIKQYLTSLENYNPQQLKFIINFLLTLEQYEGDLNFVRTLLNIINDEQCSDLHEECIRLIHKILKENPLSVPQMQNQEEDFKKLFTPDYKQCTIVSINFILSICEILYEKDIYYVLSDIEPRINSIFSRIIDECKIDQICFYFYLLDWIDLELRTKILEKYKDKIAALKNRSNYIVTHSKYLLFIFFYGFQNSYGDMEMFYAFTIFQLLDQLSDLNEAVKFLRYLWPHFYDVRNQVDIHRLVNNNSFYFFLQGLGRIVDHFQDSIQSNSYLSFGRIQILRSRSITEIYNRRFQQSYCLILNQRQFITYNLQYKLLYDIIHIFIYTAISQRDYKIIQNRYDLNDSFLPLIQ